MAQRVDNEENPEQVQKAMDQATTPTVELHRTKEDTIKEFVRQHGTISLDWYVPDLCNTRVGDLIEKRLQLGTTEGRILFSSPALSEFFKTSNFELNLQTGEVLTYLDPPGEHRYYMSERTIRHRVPQRHTARRTQHRPDARGETRKDPKRKETSWTSRRHAQRRSWIQGTPILSSLDHVCRQLSRTEKEIRTFTGKCSSSLQNVRTIHLRHYTPNRRSGENIRHGKGTKIDQKQRLLPSTTVSTKGMQNRNNPG